MVKTSTVNCLSVCIITVIGKSNSHNSVYFCLASIIAVIAESNSRLSISWNLSYKYKKAPLLGASSVFCNQYFTVALLIPYSRNLFAMAVWLKPSFLASCLVDGYEGYSLFSNSFSNFFTSCSSVPSKFSSI